MLPVRCRHGAARAGWLCLHANDERNLVKQLLRYGFVGIASNALAFGVYVLTTAHGASPKVTAGVVYVVAAGVGFVGNRQLTFAHEGSVWGAGGRYVVAHTGGFLLNLAILALLVDHYGQSHVWSQAFAIVVVAGYLFVAFKFFVFPEADADPRPEPRSMET